jgi:hypothetical protein
MRMLLLVILACAAMLLGGLALAGLPGAMGGVGVGLTLVGVAGFGAFLVFAQIKAYRTDRGLYFTPGKAYREWKAEQEAARRAERLKGGRNR